MANFQHDNIFLLAQGLTFKQYNLYNLPSVYGWITFFFTLVCKKSCLELKNIKCKNEFMNDYPKHVALV